jgi:hypothetical protein
VAQEINHKFNEPDLIRQLQAYIDSTYDEHYAQGRIQTTEFIQSNGGGIEFTRGNIIKYAQRYGMKDGRNRKDILKVLHYAIIMLNTHDIETEKERQHYENQSRNNQPAQELRNDQLEPIVPSGFNYRNDLGT